MEIVFSFLSIFLFFVYYWSEATNKILVLDSLILSGRIKDLIEKESCSYSSSIWTILFPSWIKSTSNPNCCLPEYLFGKVYPVSLSWLFLRLFWGSLALTCSTRFSCKRIFIFRDLFALLSSITTCFKAFEKSAKSFWFFLRSSSSD